MISNCVCLILRQKSSRKNALSPHIITVLCISLLVTTVFTHCHWTISSVWPAGPWRALPLSDHRTAPGISGAAQIDSLHFIPLNQQGPPPSPLVLLKVGDVLRTYVCYMATARTSSPTKRIQGFWQANGAQWGDWWLGRRTCVAGSFLRSPC